MKPNKTLNKTIVILIFVLIAITGMYIADLINSLNPQISPSVLGAIVVYLTYRNVLLPIKNEPISALFVFPANTKYFLYTLFGGIIIYWGIQQLVYIFF